MIVAALDNLGKQAAAQAHMKTALDWLARHAGDSELAERVEIDGKAVYALVQEYQTVAAGDEIKLEAHQNYIDIQYIVSGEEMMAWADVRGLQQATAYNPDKDVYHGLMTAAEVTPVQVRAGQAAIFYPIDAHAPKLAVSQPVKVRKIVIKVRVE